MVNYNSIYLILHWPKRKMRNQKCVLHIFDYSKKSFAFLRTEKCKTSLSGDVNAPSVGACFHLTAFYSGWKLLLYNIISPYIRNFGLNPTNIRLCKHNVNHLQYEIIREYHRRL